MLARMHVFIFLLVAVFAVFSACKMVRKHDVSKKVKSVSSSVVPPVAPSPKKQPESDEIPSSPFVDCSSWGGSAGSFWGYGEGLMFEGPPDGWVSGSPKYLRARGRPL